MGSESDTVATVNGMTLETALKGMSDAKSELARRQAVQSLPIMSENMQRLATYTATVEEFLADLEAKQEYDEGHVYRSLRQQDKSSNAAEQEARYATAELKAEIKRLTRLVNASWKLISTIQSRWNHLDKEAKGQV